MSVSSFQPLNPRQLDLQRRLLVANELREASLEALPSAQSPEVEVEVEPEVEEVAQNSRFIEKNVEIYKKRLPKCIKNLNDLKQKCMSCNSEIDETVVNLNEIVLETFVNPAKKVHFVKLSLVYIYLP